VTGRAGALEVLRDARPGQVRSDAARSTRPRAADAWGDGTMRYSRYALTLLVGFVVVWAGMSAALLGALGPTGIAFVILLGVIGLVIVGAALGWANRAVAEFGGAPMPGLLGALGFNVVADPPGSAFGSVGGATGGGGSTFPRGAPTGPPAAGPRPPASPVGRRTSCGKCGTTTVGAGSSYCRGCGSRLAGEVEDSSTTTCLRCGLITWGSGSAYCRVCGSSFFDSAPDGSSGPPVRSD